MENRKILLGLTTTSGSDWKEKIRETRLYDIKEIALFPTALCTSKRKELYKLLENSPVESIPHIHLRSDMNLAELDYLVNKYNTRAFNIHSEKGIYNFKTDFSKYFSKIYIENTEVTPSAEELKKFAGICVDFSHWEADTLFRQSEYKNFENNVKKYKIGCCHVSSVKKIFNVIPVSSHKMGDLKELDYFKKYVDYLPNLISIELENSFSDQLKAKEYLEKIINNN